MTPSDVIDGPNENHDSTNQQTSGEYFSSFDRSVKHDPRLYAQAPVYQHTNYYSQAQSEELSSYAESSFTSENVSQLSRSSYRSFAYHPNVTNAINPVDETGFTRGTNPPRYFPHQYLQASTTSPEEPDDTFSSNTSMSSTSQRVYA